MSAMLMLSVTLLSVFADAYTPVRHPMPCQLVVFAIHLLPLPRAIAATPLLPCCLAIRRCHSHT